MKKHLLIGVTGGIGSGKSLICNIFSVLGIPVYNADDRAKWLMSNNAGLIRKIKDLFGTESYNTDHSLNREYLANTVFSNSKQLNKLNALVHPAVAYDFSQWVLKNKEKTYLIKEAALIFETGANKNLNYVINIYTPEEVRIQRILKRDPHRGDAQVKAIIEKQLPDEKRKEMADFQIINDGKQLVIPQVLNLHNKFTAIKI